jgi:hypothetical protein
MTINCKHCGSAPSVENVNDDCGYIRSLDGKFVAISRGDDYSVTHEEHRKQGTDPYKDTGRLICAMRNTLPFILDLLEKLREENDRLKEDIERKDEVLRWFKSFSEAAAMTTKAALSPPVKEKP